MRRLADPARWPGWLLFLAMAASGGALAWVSVDLLRLAMANQAFIAEHGASALANGALEQAGWLALAGLFALCCYLVFKTAEAELVARWRRPRD